MAEVALVVGASSGLGRAVARRLAAQGYETYACARSFAAGQGETRSPEGCVPVALDVTQDASVRSAVDFVAARAGRIDVLVNCAAFLTLGSCEDTTPEELEAVVGTNLIGMARVTRAVLPQMRRQKSGRIVQFSSLNGRFAIPFQGAYAASKHAIEGYSESLAMEVRGFGIGVTLVEPGDCRSGSDAYRRQAEAALSDSSPYRVPYMAATGKIHKDEANGMDPDRVARAVAKALERRHPPARVVVARIDQRLALWLHKLLPGRWFYGIIARYYAPRAS